jgi:hypothetical protein
VRIIKVLLIFTLLISTSHGNDLALHCQNFDCYAFGSVGGGVGEGTVDHPIRNYYPKEEIDEIIEEYPPH